MLPIHMTKDNVHLGDTSLSFSLQVVHSQVQRVRGEIKEKRLSLTYVMVPLVEPLSSKILIGEANTSAAPATAECITTLSTTFAPFDVVPPFYVPDYQVLGIRNHMTKTLLPQLRSELSSFFRMACFIVSVDKVSWPEACITNPDIIVFFHFGFAFLLLGLLPVLFFYQKVQVDFQSFIIFIMSTSTVLKVVMPISTGITASVPYVSENGVSPLLDLIIV
ncbi:hypothetical protein Tco_1063833 [Tanacetum coccineum]